MKPTTTLLIVIALFISNVTILNAQDFDLVPKGGEFVFNPEKKPCITPEQRSDMIRDVQANIAALRLQNRLAYSELQRIPNPKFIWPVQKASNVTYNDVWAISNYVDHDLNFPNQLKDYNNGTKTYDLASGYNHEGVDIYTWPFAWKMMDDDGVEIIAAAAGQIIVKDDGEFDQSCDFNTTTPWNIVIVQHGDGSVAAYGHMKNGSTTSKNVGDMVSAGEYLGIVGSSGLSTGPHLHFEVLTDETFTQIIDPYFGSENSTITESWWAVQKPYVDPGINAVLTHSAVPVVFPPCPTTENPYISNDFDVSDNIVFAGYLRDQTLGDIISFEIIRPDNSSLFNIWNATVQTTASSWYYYYGPYSGYWDMVGEWKWQVTFAGETVTHTFNVTDALSVEDNFFEHTSVYPNPFNGVVNIKSNVQIKKVTIVDILGKTIKSFEETNIEKLKLSTISNGLYFISMEGENNQRKTVKLIKK